MSDSVTSRIHFETSTPLALEATFDGGRLTLDGGLAWLAKDDRQACSRVARTFRHSLATLVRQRVYQISLWLRGQVRLHLASGHPGRYLWQALMNNSG